MKKRTTTNKQRKRRKYRKGDFNCKCGAYTFIHRMFGGECDGGAYVSRFFDREMFGECRLCPHYSDGSMGDEDERRRGIVCQVLEGLEPYLQCPGLQDLIRFEDIKLYSKK